MFAPRAPAPPSADQRWASRAAVVVGGLSGDIVALQGALPPGPTGSGPGLPPAVAGSLAHLQRDLRRAATLTGPPDPALDRIWRSVLGEAGQAAQMLAGDTTGRQSPPLIVEADLDQAGQDLIALAAAARYGVPLPPR